MRIQVLNTGSTPISRGVGVKVTGVQAYQGNLYPLVVAATAADAGIGSVNVLITAETLVSGVPGVAIDDDLLLPYDTSALTQGADVYLSDTGAIAASPGTTPMRIGEVAVVGTTGAIIVATTTARSTTQVASAAGAGGPSTYTSGAISATDRSSFISVTGTQAFTLADGAFLGQRKTLRCTVAGSTPHGTITPATPKGFATVELNAVNQTVELEWAQPGAGSTKGWYIVGVSGTPTIS